MNELQETKTAEVVYDKVQEIQQAKQNIAASYLYIGQLLEELVENDAWTKYAKHLERVEDFYKEIGFSPSKARQCRQVYRIFNETVNEIGTAPAFWRLKKLAPVCKEASENKKKEWLNKANTLTTNDFKDEVRSQKGKTSQLDCEHPPDKREYYYQCQECKKWVKLENQDIHEQE